MLTGNTCTTSARGHTHVYPMSIEEYKSEGGHPDRAEKPDACAVEPRVMTKTKWLPKESQN